MNFKNIFSRKEEKNTVAVKKGNQINATKASIRKIEEIIKKREEISGDEFEHGYNIIKKYPLSVSILGSARFPEGHPYYDKAVKVANKIVKELGYAVVTGGGPGIMEAANKGAYEAGGVSIGFSIKLPKEQINNRFLTECVEFEYFSSRKTLIFFGAEAYIYFPGGFGTLDELFEVLTLMQTKKIPRTPVILVGKDFWIPFLNIIKQKLGIETKTIDMDDINLYKVVDSEDEIIDIIKNAPYREE